MYNLLNAFKQRNIAANSAEVCRELIKMKENSRIIGQFSGEGILKSVWDEVEGLRSKLP